MSVKEHSGLSPHYGSIGHHDGRLPRCARFIPAVPLQEFSFLNRILMVSAKRAFISPVSPRLKFFHSTNEFKIHQDAGEVK
jgi:hypothetical protein